MHPYFDFRIQVWDGGLMLRRLQVMQHVGR